MAISEESRYLLHQRLREVLGPSEATVLMEYLPPVGWADVVTKHDLEGLRSELDEVKERLESGFLRLDDKLERVRTEFRSTMLTVMSMVVALVAATLVVVKL